jgi:hypothetical protein
VFEREGATTPTQNRDRTHKEEAQTEKKQPQPRRETQTATENDQKKQDNHMISSLEPPPPHTRNTNKQLTGRGGFPGLARDLLIARLQSQQFLYLFRV